MPGPRAAAAAAALDSVARASTQAQQWSRTEPRGRSGADILRLEMELKRVTPRPVDQALAQAVNGQTDLIVDR